MNLLGLVGIAVGNPLLFLADQAPKVHRVSLPIRLLPTCVVHCFPQRRCLYKTHIFGKQVEVWRPDTRRLALVEHTQWCKGSSFNCSVFSAAKPAYKIWPWVFFPLNWLEIFRFAVAVFWPTFKTWSLVSKRPVQVYGNRFPPFVHRVKISRRLRTSTSLITTRQTPSTERHHSRICPVTTGTDGKKNTPMFPLGFAKNTLPSTLLHSKTVGSTVWRRRTRNVSLQSQGHQFEFHGGLKTERRISIR